MRNIPSDKQGRPGEAGGHEGSPAREAALKQWRRLILEPRRAEAWALHASLRPAHDASLGEQLRFRALELMLRLMGGGPVPSQLLHQARMLGRQAEGLGNARVEAECREAEALCCRDACLYADALQCVERAETLFTQLGEPELALSMQVRRARIYYVAGMFQRLATYGEMLIPLTAGLDPLDRHSLMSCTASAYFYLMETDPQPAHQQRCLALNEQALALARTHGNPHGQCLSHLNLALNDAMRAQVDSAREHLAAAGELLNQRTLRAQFSFARPYVEAICIFHEGQHDLAFEGMDRAIARAEGPQHARLLNNMLSTKVRLAREAGRMDVALQTARRLRQLDQDMSEAQIRLLASDFNTLSQMARVNADHEALLRHGDALERSLAERNLALSSTLAHLQAEVELRRATEAALQSTRDELEQKAQARTQGVREARQLLARQEKLAALGSLGAGLAHELNTPIGNARLVASALHDRAHPLRAQLEAGSVRRADLAGLAQEAQGGAVLLQQSLQRLQQLARQFQGDPGDPQEAEATAPAAFDAASLAHQVLQELEPQARPLGARLRLDASGACTCLGDTQAFAQVLRCLVDNALRHGLDGSNGGQVRVALRADAGQMELVVSDDGCGVPAAHASRVFEPFFTTRFGQGSSGLGLHLAQQLVQQRLHGEIGLSPPRAHTSGAQFVLRFPLSSQTQANA